jgi:hypothetical protein
MLILRAAMMGDYAAAAAEIEIVGMLVHHHISSR